MPVNINSQAASISNQTATSASQTAQTITIPAVANRRAVIRSIVVFSSAAGNATLVINDNAVTIVNFGTLALTTAAITPWNGAVASALFNQAMQVVVGALSAVGTTTVSVIADYVEAWE